MDVVPEGPLTQESKVPVDQEPKAQDPKGYTESISPTQLINMSEIFSDSEFNCRGKLRPLDYSELAKSIAEKGLIQPIIVQPWSDPKHPDRKYRIVVGHCRHAACKSLGWPKMPSMVRDYTDDDAFYANIIENLNRVQLNIAQEAKLVDVMRRKGITPDNICAELQKNRQWVEIRIGYNNLPDKIKTDILANNFSSKSLLQLVKLVTPQRQFTFLRKLKQKQARNDNEIQVDAMELSMNFHRIQSEKRYRKSSEIGSLCDRIYEAFGPNLATRCLAWAAGRISFEELYDTIEDAAAEEGVVFARPRDLRDSLTRQDI